MSACHTLYFYVILRACMENIWLKKQKKAKLYKCQMWIKCYALAGRGRRRKSGKIWRHIGSWRKLLAICWWLDTAPELIFFPTCCYASCRQNDSSLMTFSWGIKTEIQHLFCHFIYSSHTDVCPQVAICTRHMSPCSLRLSCLSRTETNLGIFDKVKLRLHLSPMCINFDNSYISSWVVGGQEKKKTSFNVHFKISICFAIILSDNKESETFIISFLQGRGKNSIQTRWTFSSGTT